jgi:hypothetical protein
MRLKKLHEACSGHLPAQLSSSIHSSVTCLNFLMPSRGHHNYHMHVSSQWVVGFPCINISLHSWDTGEKGPTASRKGSAEWMVCHGVYREHNVSAALSFPVTLECIFACLGWFAGVEVFLQNQLH